MGKRYAPGQHILNQAQSKVTMVSTRNSQVETMDTPKRLPDGLTARRSGRKF